MRPDDIPQDVWDAAADEAAKYVEWLTPKPTEYGQAEHVLSVSIARAIMAERERCAGVVALYADHPHVIAQQVADEIATAIRAGKE